MSDSKTETLTLLRRFQDGDKEALDCLIRRYTIRLLPAAKALLGPTLRSKVDPMDLVQDTLLRALRHLPTFKPKSPQGLSLWLSAVLRNRARALHAHFRFTKRDFRREDPLLHPELRSSWDVLLKELPGPDKTPSMTLMAEEEKRRFDRGMGVLTPEQRQVIKLRLFEESPFEEIGGLLGRPAATVRQIYFRARAKLAIAMEIPPDAPL